MKTPDGIGDNNGEATEYVNSIITYLVEEGFVPKAKDNKKVHVWVYN